MILSSKSRFGMFLKSLYMQPFIFCSWQTAGKLGTRPTGEGKEKIGFKGCSEEAWR